MKFFAAVTIAFLLSGCTTKGKYFEIAESDPFEAKSGTRVGKFYEIKSTSEKITLGLPLQVKNSNREDTLNMIKELLSMEGDNRICGMPIMNWNTALSQLVPDSLHNYSIQLQALFLINQIYFKEPFNYSPVPALIDKTSSRIETIEGDLIKHAFLKYNEWFKKIEEMGLSEASKLDLRPLQSEDGVKWLFGYRG